MGVAAMIRGALRSTRVLRLDWAALSSKVTSDSGKAELNALRAAYSDIVKQVDSAPATPPTIDWAKWKATIKTPGIVDGRGSVRKAERARDGGQILSRCRSQVRRRDLES